MLTLTCSEHSRMPRFIRCVTTASRPGTQYVSEGVVFARRIPKERMNSDAGWPQIANVRKCSMYITTLSPVYLSRVCVDEINVMRLCWA